MARPTPWRPRFKIHHLARNAMGGFPSDELLRQIREHAEIGERVRVRRPGFRAYDVVRNGPAFLVLQVLDAWAEAVRRGEFDAEGDGCPHPRGAA